MNAASLPSMGRWSCLGGACLGALGLLGWVAVIPALTTWVPGHPPMMPNTGLGLLLLGIAGVLVELGPGRLPQSAALPAALAALALGLGTLAQYLLGIEMRLDQLFVPSTGSMHPGRPSPPTALAFTLLASALLFRPKRPRAPRAGQVPPAFAGAERWQRMRARLSEGLLLLAGLIAFTALLGQLFGAGEFYPLARAPVIGVAVPTAVGLLLVPGGLLLERPEAGVVRVASAAGPGGMLVRRLGPYVILVPVLLGVLVLELFAALGIEEVRLAIASVAGVTTVGGLLLLIITAKPLERAHHALEMTRARTQELLEQAPEGIFVADLSGRYTDVNGAGCRMLGYSREELIGMTILDLLAPEDAERLWQSKAQMLEGQAHVAEWTLRRKDGSQFPAQVSAKILADGRWQGFVRDISEHRQALEQIRQARERFELALRGADLAAWDWNIVTGEVIFNPRWAEMRGVRPEAVRPHVESWTRGVHPEDLPRVQQALAEHFQGIAPEYQSEHRVLKESGEWIWILDRGKVFARDPRGQPTRMVGTELDITERKRLEEVLRLSQAKFSGIVSISADAIISIDAEQRITLFNAGAEKIFGYSQAEALGAPLDMLMPERFRARHREHVRRFASGGDTARRMEGRSAGIVGLRKDGAEFPADAAISRLDLAGERILTVALRDISEQRRVESEQTFLAEVGKVLGSTLDYEETLTNVAQLAVLHVSDVCMVDIVEEDGRLRRPKVASRDPTKAWACDVLMRLPIDRTRPHLAQASLETGRSVLFEHFSPEMLESLAQSADHLRALRAFDPQSAAVVPLLALGKPLGVIALVSSTPSRPYGSADLRLAEGLAQRAALSIENARLYRAARQAVQARDDVLGIVAHDLRNPLGTILMQAELLRRRVLEPQGLPSKPADVIERAAARMNRLIQDLLDVSRMEAGHLSIEQSRLPAAQVASDALEAQRALASSASVQLRLDLEPQLPEVWADRDRLLQVFENLIGNALRFTSAGGQVLIGAKARGRDVLFRVSDTGAGIASEHLPHLFDRFWQAKQTGRQGAGLGLPIVKGIVEAHGGQVWVDSSPGRGSTFCFTIPTAPRAEEPRQPTAAPHGPGWSPVEGSRSRVCRLHRYRNGPRGCTATGSTSRRRPLGSARATLRTDRPVTRGQDRTDHMLLQPSVTHHGRWTPRGIHETFSGGGALAAMAVFLPVALSGCVRAPLVPLMSSDEHGVVTVERAGIELTAEVNAGVLHLPDSVTPIRITVTNRSDNGIYVDPDDMELATGEEEVAWKTIPREELPPPRALGLGMDPASPYASAQGASASSGAASGYFGMSPSTSYVSGGWRDPTNEAWISSTALTAGFVDIGESRRGYVYFTTPPEGVDRLSLRVRVRLGSGSGPAETFEIPYAVPG